MSGGLYQLADRSPEELRALVARARELAAGAAPRRFSGRALGLLFLAPSLRTQASMQRAAQLLGLDVVLLSSASVWGLETRDDVPMDGEAAEHVREAAGVLSRYVDVLGVRAFARFRSRAEDDADPLLGAFLRWAQVPVLNLESTLWHPCQALADWATLDALDIPAHAKLVLCWTAHPKALPRAVPNSVIQMAALRGMQVVVHAPEGYELCPRVVGGARALATAGGGSVEYEPDRARALAGAAVVYAKSWAADRDWSDPQGGHARREALRDSWCVRPDWLGRPGPAPGARFFHCLPVRRGVVVDPAVLDSPASAVLEQAAYRLWAQAALLEALLETGAPPARRGRPATEEVLA